MDLRPVARRSIVAALTLVLAVSITVVADPPSASAAFPGAVGRIAWQRDETGTNHIWSMNGDGSDPVDLGEGQVPSWSADGKKLVFSSSSGIAVMDADGSDRSLVLDHGWMPTWSPDGQKIAFAGYEDNNYDVYVMDANGTNVVNLTNLDTEERDPSWSPNGNKIAYMSNGNVWVMDADGANPTNLTAGSGGGEPDWSPDGTKILFQLGGINVMNADGSNKTQILNDGYGPTWSPDGTRIAYATSTELGWDVYSVAANGTNPVRLTSASLQNTATDWFPSWQPTAFTMTPSSMAFGNGVIGTPTASKTVTFRAGLDPVSVTSVALAGPDAGQFQKTSDSCSGVVVAAKATCSVAVRFAATTAGPKVADLTFSGPSPLGSAVIPITGTGRHFLWSARLAAGPNYTFNYGRSLTSTTTATKTYVHGVYTGVRVGGRFVTDSGPRAGAYYIRSSNKGKTWATPKRLNPTTQHGSQVSIASSSRYVYTAWISTKKWVRYNGSSPRTLYFRRNTQNGSSTAWSSTIRLTSTLGRVDAPTIAASGAYVYVTWTDANTGSIRVAISSNHGRTFRKITVGSTTNAGSSGKAGLPRIAAAGSEVAVVWIAAGDGTTKVRTATAFGGTWGSEMTLGQTGAVPDVAMVGNRLALAWASDDRIQVRVRTAGVWASTVALPDSDGHASTEVHYDPAIALFGGGLGVAYSSCLTFCEGGSNEEEKITSDLIWRQSTDDGATWSPSDTLSTSSGPRRRNDSASVVWKVAKRPFVMWNGWIEDSSFFRLSIRGGA